MTLAKINLAFTAGLLLCSPLRAQIDTWMTLGTPGMAGTSGVGVVTMNTTGNMIAIQILTPAARTLSEARIYLAAAPVGSGDLVADIYTNGATGDPGTLVASSAAIQTAGKAAGDAADLSFATATGCTAQGCTLAANTLYWLVVRNPLASPAANYASVRYAGTNNGLYTNIIGARGGGFGAVKSSTGGIAGPWTGYAGAVPFFRLKWSDGMYGGLPYTNFATDVANAVYGTRETGTLFVMPGSGITYNVRGVCMLATRVGMPTGPFRMKLYTGSTGALTEYITGTFATGTMDTGARTYCLYFDRVVPLTAGSTARVAFSDASPTGTSTNRFQTQTWTVDTDISSQTLRPLGSSTQQAFCASDCTTAANWTLNNGAYVPFSLVLESNRQLSAAPGGGSYTFVE